jgi:integrase
MSIFKRGSVYWFHFLYNGEHVQRSTKQGNPRVARQIEAAYRTALAKGEVGIDERKKAPGFKAAMRSFLAWSEQEHKEHPATFRRHKISSIALLSHFGDQPLDRITAADVEQFKAARAMECKTVRGKQKGERKQTRKRIRPATVNRELACLRAMFNHVIKGDVPLKNPVSKTAAKAFPENNEQTRVLAFDEQARYLAAATPLLRDVATLMLETGMRPEEVYRIRPENVNLGSGFLFNPYGKTKAARRRVPLNTAARNVLARRMAGLETPFIFPCDTDRARPVPKVNNAHDRAVKNAKVARFRLYDLRHTWATRAAESGIDLVTLAALLGHSKIQMVLRYAHPTQEHQARSVERMEQFVAARQMEALLPEQDAEKRVIQ